MHARQKVCAHDVVTGSTRAHWQIAQIWCQLGRGAAVASEKQRVANKWKGEENRWEQGSPSLGRRR